MSVLVSPQSYRMPMRNLALRHIGHPLAINLESCWLFSEGVGTTVQDCTGLHPMTLDLTALSWTRSGIFHNGIISSPTAGTTRGTVSGYPLLDVEYSIEVWLYITGTDSYGAILMGGTGLYTRNIGSGPQMNLWANTGGDHLSSHVLKLNAWSQSVVTYKNTSELTFYTNGLYNNKFTGFTTAGFTPTSIFNDVNSETFQGTMSLMRVWRRRCLTPLEVKTLYNDPLGMFINTQTRRSTAVIGGGGDSGSGGFFQFFV